MAKHKHKVSLIGWTGGIYKDHPLTVVFNCKCGEQIIRKATKKEKEKHKLQISHSNNIHKIFREYIKLENEYKNDLYKLQCVVERWAKKYPKHVSVIGCDDDYHSSSVLVLIEHRTEHYYHGTTVVFIPQCAGHKPVRFFLYENHLDNLIKTLVNIRKRSKSSIKGEKMFRAKLDKMIDYPVGWLK